MRLNSCHVAAAHLSLLTSRLNRSTSSAFVAEDGRTTAAIERWQKIIRAASEVAVGGSDCDTAAGAYRAYTRSPRIGRCHDRVGRFRFCLISPSSYHMHLKEQSAMVRTRDDAPHTLIREKPDIPDNPAVQFGWSVRFVWL